MSGEQNRAGLYFRWIVGMIYPWQREQKRANDRGYPLAISSADILKTGWKRIQPSNRFADGGEYFNTPFPNSNLDHLDDVPIIDRFFFKLLFIFIDIEFWTKSIGRRWKGRLLEFSSCNSVLYNFRPIYDFVHEAKENALKVCDESETKGRFAPRLAYLPLSYLLTCVRNGTGTRYE